MKRILVVTVNWLGDAIMSQPIFKALREKLPEAYLAVMVPERVRGVFDDDPYIDQVIVFDERRKQKGLVAKIKFIKGLRRVKFDTVFLVHRSFTKAMICYLAAIPRRIGYRRPKNFLVLTDPVSAPKGLLHRQDYYFSLFESQGIEIRERIPSIYIPDKVRHQVNISLQALRQKHAVIIGINPAANWRLKRWPAERFSQLADYLIEKHQAAIIFTGVTKEKNTIAKVIAGMRHPVYDFCGKTNLKELAALISNCKVFISNDSGPAHLAASLAVPTLVLFGPTAREITAPRGKKVMIIQKDTSCKIPCYKLDCRINKCMLDISLAEVKGAADKLISDD